MRHENAMLKTGLPANDRQPMIFYLCLVVAVALCVFVSELQWGGKCFSDFQSESPCKGAHGFISQWS